MFPFRIAAAWYHIAARVSNKDTIAESLPLGEMKREGGLGAVLSESPPFIFL